MFFGPLLTHSSHVTFPWQPLRHALHTYFGSGPASLDPVRTATRVKEYDLTRGNLSSTRLTRAGPVSRSS